MLFVCKEAAAADFSTKWKRNAVTFDTLTHLQIFKPTTKEPPNDEEEEE